MTRVKICGIRFFDDGFSAIEAGADYLGFNFYPESPRYIEPAVCKKITFLLRAQYPKIKFVGVFVNEEAEQVLAIKKYCLLDLVQLHGDEPPEFLTRLGPGTFKAFRGIPENLNGYLQNQEPSFLLDAASTKAYGGTGTKTDWDAAARFAEQHAIFLAGGLNADNVAEAIALVHPWGVDTASGVESAPGFKDKYKMKSFVKMVHLADKAALELNTTTSMLESK